MEKCLIERIDKLRIHLTTSQPVKLQEVVDTWNEFCMAIGQPKARKHPTGCISCVRHMIQDMVKHIDGLPYTNLDTNSETNERSEDAMPAKEDGTKKMKNAESTAKPHKKKGRKKF